MTGEFGVRSAGCGVPSAERGSPDELRVVWTSHFKKDYKLAQRRHYDIVELKRIVRLLAQRQPLPEQNRDHPLHNNWEGFRECHIASDWLLVYQIVEDRLVLSLARTGTHSDLRF